MTDNAHSRHELPAGWVWTTLGEISRVNRRDPALRDLHDDLPVTFLPMSAVDAAHGTIATPEVRRLADVRKGFSPFSEGDVLFAKITPSMENGKAAIATGLINGRGFGSTEFHVLSPGDSVLAQWLFYFVRQESFRAGAKASFTGTAGQLRVPAKFLEESRIPLPPLPEQHRIVAEIETQFTRLDAGVAALKRVQAKLRRYKASVLKAACEGRLVPTEAELARVEGRNYESASALLTRILAERRVQWQQANPGKRYVEPKGVDADGLGALPEGWVWASMEQLADVVGGVTKGRNLVGQKTLSLPYLRVANVQQGWLDLAEVKEIEALPDDLKKYELKYGDLLMTEGGDRDKLGRSAIWRDAVKDCIHQNHIFRARAFHPGLLSEWLMYNANSEQGRQYFMKQGKQTTNLASINLTQLRGFPVPLPPTSEQYRIVAEVERRLSVAQEVESAVAASLRRAERLRQSILKRAFEGRLAAQDAGNEPQSALPAQLPGAGADDTAML